MFTKKIIEKGNWTLIKDKVSINLLQFFSDSFTNSISIIVDDSFIPKMKKKILDDRHMKPKNVTKLIPITFINLQGERREEKCLTGCYAYVHPSQL